MSDLVLAEKDPAVVLAAALKLYTQTTGVTLAQADPRRLHLQALLLLLSQQRQLIDFSGKQNLLRYVSDTFIDVLAELWGAPRIPAKASTCTVRFSFATTGAPNVVPQGTRVTDGISTWAVDADTPGTTPIDAPVTCIVAGAASNGVAPGQIATLVDAFSDCNAVSNTTETLGGRDVEQLEAYRTRLRDVPESSSTCGPRLAYQAAALNTAPEVIDALAIGPDDSDDIPIGDIPPPGNVHVYIIEGTRDSAGNVLTAIPAPSGGLIAEVLAALSAEDVRPLTDFVSVLAPAFFDYDIDVTYYISRDRAASALEIEAAVEAAVAAYELWQTKIGRDINPSELIAQMVNAGAKRVTVASPSFSAIQKSTCSRRVYLTVTYGGVEND